jgi:hypothetical protein
MDDVSIEPTVKIPQDQLTAAIEGLTGLIVAIDGVVKKIEGTDEEEEVNGGGHKPQHGGRSRRAKVTRHNRRLAKKTAGRRRK